MNKDHIPTWKMKTDRLGEWTPAVKRRHDKYKAEYQTGKGISEGALTTHQARSRFGYNYLEPL